MSHFARVKNGFVQEVIVAEQDFIDSVADTTDGKWIQTSYNTFGGVHYVPDSNPRIPSDDQSKALRKNYASKGMRYDPNNDAFYDLQPFSSWTLNTETYLWESPTEMPTDGYYTWNEETQSWDAVETE